MADPDDAEQLALIAPSSHAPRRLAGDDPTSPHLPVASVLVDTGLAPSRKEARRLLQQGGVSLDEEKVTDEGFTLAAESGASYLLRVGKRKFLTLVVD